jgi:hypothetical protein
MIEEAQIVKDTRRVRRAISEKFGNDPDRYIDYLLSQKIGTEAKMNGFMSAQSSDDRNTAHIPRTEL